MSTGWTEERRRKQAETIRRNRPWEKSTGPRTEAGKFVSSQNAFKHGGWGAESACIREVLKLNKEFVKKACDLNALMSLKVQMRNKLLDDSRKSDT